MDIPRKVHSSSARNRSAGVQTYRHACMYVGLACDNPDAFRVFSPWQTHSLVHWQLSIRAGKAQTCPSHIESRM